jgi:hypothetical protein
VHQPEKQRTAAAFTAAKRCTRADTGMKRYVKASIGTLEQQEQAEGMAMVLPRKAQPLARPGVVMVLPRKAPLRARLDVVMVLPQKAPLQARPQEPLQARPQEPLWEPQSEMAQAFIMQSEAQPSEILRPLLQFRPTACVVHAEGSYAAESALAAITLTGFGCGPEFPPLSIVARTRLADSCADSSFIGDRGLDGKLARDD